MANQADSNGRSGWLLVALLSALLGGCSGGYAPVSDRSVGRVPSPSPVTPVTPVVEEAAFHQVQRGDTLYSIAWRYGKDYRSLARLNAIGSDYRIYPGQKLALKGAPPPPAPVASRATAPPRSAPAAGSAASRPSSAPSSGSSTTGKASPVNVSPPAASAPSRPVPSTLPAGPPTWRWPASGQVIGRFNDSGNGLNKGLDIAGQSGDPVRAAADGWVVYAGSGLLGYGNLIIINHNEEFLSAYAHNRKLLVKEQDHVKTGDKIAEMGKTGTNRPMLHFEIRRDGQPVDPLRYLPRR